MQYVKFILHLNIVLYICISCILYSWLIQGIHVLFLLVFVLQYSSSARSQFGLSPENFNGLWKTLLNMLEHNITDGDIESTTTLLATIRILRCYLTYV